VVVRVGFGVLWETGWYFEVTIGMGLMDGRGVKKKQHSGRNDESTVGGRKKWCW
jgi:hypothetical protein